MDGLHLLRLSSWKTAAARTSALVLLATAEHVFSPGGCAPRVCSVTSRVPNPLTPERPSCVSHKSTLTKKQSQGARKKRGMSTLEGREDTFEGIKGSGFYCNTFLKIKTKDC